MWAFLIFGTGFGITAACMGYSGHPVLMWLCVLIAVSCVGLAIDEWEGC